MSPKCVKLLFSIMGPRRHSHTVNIHSLLMYHFGDFDLSWMFSLETFSQLSHMHLFFSHPPSIRPLYRLSPSFIPPPQKIFFLLPPSPFLSSPLFSSHLPSFFHYFIRVKTNGQSRLWNREGSKLTQSARSWTRKIMTLTATGPFRDSWWRK